MRSFLRLGPRVILFRRSRDGRGCALSRNDGSVARAWCQRRRARWQRYFELAVGIEQVRVHHLARDRRGERRTEAAVFHDHRHGDARMLGWRERDEPRVVAQAIGHGFLVVEALVARDREHLRGAGLAGNRVGHVLPGERRGRAVPESAGHAFRDDLPLLGADVLDLLVLHGWEALHFTRGRIAHANHEARLIRRAAIRDDRRVVCELQRRDEEVALANPEVHRFAGEPDLVRGALERLALPFLRRQQAWFLAADVDTGEAAEAEQPEELGDVIHADVAGETVEVHVTGPGDGMAQVRRAMTAGSPFAEGEAAAGQVPRARAEL